MIKCIIYDILHDDYLKDVRSNFGMYSPYFPFISGDLMIMTALNDGTLNFHSERHGDT